MNKILVVFIAIIGFVLTGNGEAGRGKELMEEFTIETMEAKSNEIIIDLARFQEGDIQSLKQVFDQLVAFGSYKESDADQRSSVRKMQAGLWLQTLTVVDSKVDREFDFDDVPLINIAPSGPYPAGISPDAIKDVELRKQYEQAIAQNEKKRRQYMLQHKLVKMQKHLLDEAENFFVRKYSKGLQESNELRELLDAHNIDHEFKIKILKQIKSSE